MAKKKANKPSQSSDKGKSSGGGLAPPAKAGIIAAIIFVVLGLFFVKKIVSDPASPDVTASSSDVSSTDAPASAGTDTVPLAITSVDMESILSRKLPVIIDFGADSCIPCKEMAPVLVKLNSEYQGSAVIHFVDVWKNGSAADGFPVSVIPTQIFILPDGSPYLPSEDIGIEFTMYNDKTTGEHIFTVHQGGLTEEQMRAILADMGAVL